MALFSAPKRIFPAAVVVACAAFAVPSTAQAALRGEITVDESFDQFGKCFNDSDPKASLFSKLTKCESTLPNGSVIHIYRATDWLAFGPDDEDLGKSMAPPYITPSLAAFEECKHAFAQEHPLFNRNPSRGGNWRPRECWQYAAPARGTLAR